MEKTFEERKKYVLENIDVLMYYDRGKLLREGVYNNGKEDGLEEGIEEGEKRKSLEIAKKMITRGDNLDDIEEITGLSKEEILKLNS